MVKLALKKKWISLRIMFQHTQDTPLTQKQVSKFWHTAGEPSLSLFLLHSFPIPHLLKHAPSLFFLWSILYNAFASNQAGLTWNLLQLIITLLTIVSLSHFSQISELEFNILQWFKWHYFFLFLCLCFELCFNLCFLDGLCFSFVPMPLLFLVDISFFERFSSVSLRSFDE